MKKASLYLLLLATCFFSQAQDTITISMSDAVKIALKNNLQLRNDDLKLRQATFAKSKNLYLAPAEVNFKYGQLYSSEKGWQTSIMQELGPITQLKRIEESESKANNLLEKEKNLDSKKVELQTKSIYLRWIYLYNKLQITKTKYDYVQKLRDDLIFTVDSDQTDFTEQAIRMNQISEIETEYYENLYDIEITANDLRQLMNIPEFILPSNQKLELYMIKKPDDTSSYTGHYNTDIIQARKRFYDSQAKLDKTSCLPSIKFGFFVQNIAPFSTLAGFEAGMKIPLFYGSIKEKVKESELLSQQSESEYQQALLQSNLQIEKLITQLDKNFLKIRHYQDYSLPVSDLLINNATLQYQKEEIKFDEFIQIVNQALQIRMEYLDEIDSYNQTALQLELYAN
jgi:heavy metal efflux system protein